MDLGGCVHNTQIQIVAGIQLQVQQATGFTPKGRSDGDILANHYTEDEPPCPVEPVSRQGALVVSIYTYVVRRRLQAVGLTGRGDG
jgi:hypothetical protein